MSASRGRRGGAGVDRRRRTGRGEAAGEERRRRCDGRRERRR